jgi:FkbM family methyltransferase
VYLTEKSSWQGSAKRTLEGLLINYARRFPLRKGKLRVIEALWKATVREHETERMAALRYGGFKLPCDLREDLQRQFYFFGTYFAEERILACWEREARGAKVFFDVGANLGIFSFAALAVEPNATVHAFEPTPEIASQLRKAAELNGLRQLNVHELAASSVNGHARLNRCRGDAGTNGGMNFIFGSANDGDPDRVATVRLDDFCEDNAIGHIDLLKADVQGHEHDVFKGAQRLLKAGRVGLVFFELNWGRDLRSCPAERSIRLLGHCGYEFAAVGPTPKWRQAGDWMHGMGDALARRSVRSESGI